MTFKTYFGGLNKSNQIFLKTCEEFEEVDLEKEFDNLGDLLFKDLWDDFGEDDNKHYLTNLEMYADGSFGI